MRSTSLKTKYLKKLMIYRNVLEKNPDEYVQSNQDKMSGQRNGKTHKMRLNFYFRGQWNYAMHFL